MAAMHPIRPWTSEDGARDARRGGRTAARRRRATALALVLSAAVWMLWSVVVVHLPAAGFRYTINQLFWLAALPALCGATLRVFQAFAPPAFRARRFGAIVTASLLVPAIGIGVAVQDPGTPFEVMIALALLCGLGGAHFARPPTADDASADAHGAAAAAVHAGLGPLGIALAQLAVPLVVATALFGNLAGAPQPTADGPMWLQNAGFVWVPLIAASALAGWFGADDDDEARDGLAGRAASLARRHGWLMGALHLGTFGSVVGFAAGLPLLLRSQFPAAELLHLVGVGPLVAVLAAPLGVWLADRLGGARVTMWTFAAMALGVVAVLQTLPAGGAGGHVEGFLAGFVVLFAAAGLGHGSTLRMISAIVAAGHRRAAGLAAATPDTAPHDGTREAAAVLGFAGAIGAYGGFFVPKSLGTAIALTGGPAAALGAFVAFYLACIALTWWHCGRRYASMPC